jgi:hypothetical protein
MPWYRFTAVWPDGRCDNAGMTNTPGDDAARRYARLLIKELKGRTDYRDPPLKMMVQNSNDDVIQVIPF